MFFKHNIFPFFVLITCPLVFSSCSGEKQIEEAIRPVRYVEVYSTGGSRTRTFSGVARAGLESKLSFKVPGTISLITVKVGDEVDASDPIARLDPTDYQLRVQTAEAALANAEAQARNAKANYERVRALWENKSASTTDLDAARAANESATAGAVSAQKQLELARAQLGYTRLNAPVAGAIAQVLVEKNENVKAGETVVTLTSSSRIEVEVSIPEALISKIREGDTVSVKFDAIPDREFSAVITEVGVVSTGLGTTFPVTVQLDRADPDIRPGMAAVTSFRFESRDDRERFILPTIAVSEDRRGRFVYVAEPIEDEPGFATVRRASVTVGEITTDGLEVFEGLTDGDRVITAGISRISEGQKVRI